MGLFDRIKNFFKRTFSGGSSGGGGGSPGRGGSTSYDRASRVSNYGGGGGRSYNDYSSGGYEHEYQSYQRRRELERQERKRKQQATTNALASISKRTDALSSGRSSSTASSATSTGTTRVLARIGQKATPPDPKETARQTSQQRATAQLKKIADKVESESKSYNKATGNKYNAHTGDKAHDARARQRIKMGEYQSDPNAEKWEVKHHPIAASASRGALSGVTFGGSELLAQTSKRRRETGAEQYYQANKNKWAEMGGEAAGTLIGFGLTGGASAGALGRLAPKTLTSKGVSKLAASKAIQRAAEKEAVKRFGVEGATKEAIAQIARRRASSLMAELGKDVATDATTGLMSDLTHSYLDATKDGKFDRGEFAKSMGENVALNTLFAGATSVVPAFRVGKRADTAQLDKLVRKASKDATDTIHPGEAVSIRDMVPNRDKQMRDAIIRRANEADEALDRSVVARGDAFQTSTIDPNATMRDIRQMANVTNGVRDARRQSTLDDLLLKARARATQKPQARRSISDLVNVRNAEDVARQTRINELDAELDNIQREILLKRNTAPEEELESLNARFQELLTERNSLRDVPVARATDEADDLRQQYIDRRNELQEEWDKWERGESNLTPYEIEEMGDELDRLDEQIKATEASEPPRRTETQPAPEAVAEPPRAEPQMAETPRAETVEPTQPKAEPPQSKAAKERDKAVRKSFAEKGEADLGLYGQISRNGDGSYRLSIDGAGERTLTEPEAKKYMNDSLKRLNAKPKVVDSIEDVVYKRRERISNREKIEKAAKSLRKQIFDSLSAFEDAERKQAKAAGRQVDYGAIDEVRRYQAIANRSTGNKQVTWNGDEFGGTVKRIGADGAEYEIENGKSIKDIYKDMDEATERDFDAYLTLRHAPDRLREGKPVFDNIVDKRGLNFNDPNVCRAEADRLLQEHPEFARKAEEIYQYTQNELKNRVDAGLLKQSVVDDWNKKYPFYVPTGRDGFNELHGISGSTIGAEELEVAKGSDLGIRSIRDQLEASTTRNWKDMTLNEMFKRTFGDRIAEELAQEADGGMQKVLDNTISLSKDDGGRYFADIFIDGKKYKVNIEDRFYEALDDLYKNGRIGNTLIDTTNDAFSKVATVWKNLITEWSPIFMVKNGMRDFPEAIINSRQTKEFIGSMGAAWKDLINGGEYSTALKNAGISQSSFIDLDKAIKTATGEKSKLARANELIELYPRLVEYMATFKKAGVDLKDADKALRTRAAANAADVTVNFGRSGSVGKMLNRGFVPFFNPSAQGWSKFVRNISEQPGTKERLAFLAKATALGAGVNTLNNYLLQDNENYQMISARDKSTHYIIPIGDPDSTNLFIKIPSSRFAAAYGLPSVNLFNDNKMGWAEAIKVANDQVAPIDPLESTLLSPFIAASKNETWYGSPIVPGALEDLPKSEQYDANTSYLGRALGKATEKLPRELQISPKKADYIIDAETGVIGDFALPMLTPSRQGGGGPVGKVLAPAANVVKRQFTIDSVTQNDLSSRFYEKLREANTNKKSIHGNEKDEAEYKRLSKYSTEVSSITKAITELQNGDRPTKQDDIYGLQKVRNQLLQDALDGKKAPGSGKTLDAVQKYVGTTYAINNFGSSDDKEALKVYGAAVYGNLSEAEMQKKMDADKSFYTGVRAIINLEDKMTKAGATGKSSTLAKSVALASVGANDELFGAYKGANKSRTETENEMGRARTYMASGGSVDEFVQLERTRKTLGKLSDYDKEAELDNALSQLKSGEISQTEYYQKAGEIKYNANISYVGLATSLAQANAPARGYVLYDIKAKNIRKGINLAAMGFTARDYREMAKAVDADGNGYPKKQEIIDYVANSDVADKATLYDALYYYKSSRNPFGAVTNYSREQAAATGKANGVKAISNETGEIDLVDDEANTGYTRSGYRRRRGGYRRYGYSGGGSTAKATVPKPKTIKASDFKQGESLAGKSKSSSKAKVTPPKLKRVQAKIDLPTVR